MDFRVLGPLTARSGGQSLHLGGPRQRALLAYLLLHANEVVRPDRLLDALWHEPPPGGTAALHTQIFRLRKVVGQRLVTSPGGYLLEVEPDELDLHCLRRLLAAAAVADTPAERAGHLREGEALWHGDPLSDIDAPFVQAESSALEELRLAALEERFDADLERGLTSELLPELSALVVQEPLRERLRAQQMLALYRAGRQADALEAYQAARRTLDDELGLEPSPSLRELERAILTHDAALDGPPAPHIARPAKPRRRGALLGLAAAALAVAGAASAYVVSRDGPARPAAPPAHVANVAKPLAAPAAHVRKAHRRAAHVARPRTTTMTTTAITTLKVVSAQRPHISAPPRTMTTAAAAKHSEPASRTVVPAARSAPTTTTTPAAWSTMSDDFSSSSPNWTLWSVGTEGTGPTFEPGSGSINFKLPADSEPGGSYDQATIEFTFRCTIPGNFDTQVHYRLLDWPAANGAIVQLSAWTLPTPGSSTSRDSNQNGESYFGNEGSTFNGVPTNDQQGTLRVARHGSLVTSYVRWSDGKWLQLHSGNVAGKVTLGLQLFAPSAGWAHQPVAVAFDDFRVSSPLFHCS